MSAASNVMFAPCRELTLHHGYPLRVVAPGIAGTRSVKWLRRIIASKYAMSRLRSLHQL